MIKDKLQELVDRQSNQPWLWAIPMSRKQTIQEFELQRALRELHEIIEARETRGPIVFELFGKN